LPAPAKLAADSDCHAWIESIAGTELAVRVDGDQALRLDGTKASVARWDALGVIVTSQTVAVPVAKFLPPNEIQVLAPLGVTLRTLYLESGTVRVTPKMYVSYNSACHPKDAALAVIGALQVQAAPR
jgi:hypothetical protein